MLEDPGGKWEPVLEEFPEQRPLPKSMLFALGALTSGAPNFGFGQKSGSLSHLASYHSLKLESGNYVNRFRKCQAAPCKTLFGSLG